MSDPIDPGELADRIVGHWSGPVEWHPSIDSTNSALVDRARAGAEEGLVIGADHQTAGRGRRGRVWVDDPGTSLAMSVVLRPQCAPGEVGLLAIVAALGVARALQDLSGSPAEIVWPNDVLLDGAKTSGILCESSLSARQVDWVVVGIGVNVGAAPTDVGGRWTPGSLAAAGFRGTRLDAATAVLTSLGRVYEQWRSDGADDLLAVFADRDALHGRELVVATSEGEVRGRGAGIDGEGRLRVARGDQVSALAAGDVTHVER